MKSVKNFLTWPLFKFLGCSEVNKVSKGAMRVSHYIFNIQI